MSTTYTYFNKDFWGRSAVVYEGVLKDLPKASENPQPAYLVDIQWRSITVSEVTTHGTRELVSGKFEGFWQRSAVIHGYHSIATAKNRSVLRSGWSFVDYSSNEYTWRVSPLNNTFTLTDINGTTIAIFHRNAWKIKKTGTLDIVVKVPESLLVLILVTCKFVHNTAKANEHH